MALARSRKREVPENPVGGLETPERTAGAKPRAAFPSSGFIRVAVMLFFFGIRGSACSWLVIRLRGGRLGGAIVQKPCGLLDEGFDSLP